MKCSRPGNFKSSERHCILHLALGKDFLNGGGIEKRHGHLEESRLLRPAHFPLIHQGACGGAVVDCDALKRTVIIGICNDRNARSALRGNERELIEIGIFNLGQSAEIRRLPGRQSEDNVTAVIEDFSTRRDGGRVGRAQILNHGAGVNDVIGRRHFDGFRGIQG